MPQTNQQIGNRVTVAALAGAITSLLVWFLEDFAAIFPPSHAVVGLTVISTFFVGIVYSRFPGLFHNGDRQSGRAHPGLLVSLILAAVLALTMAGCQSSGHRAPATVYESLLVANAYGEQITRTVNDLRRRQVITTDQHQLALDYLQESLNASRLARVAYQAGDFSTSQGALDRTEAALMAVARLLQPFMPDDPESQAFQIRYAGGAP